MNGDWIKTSTSKNQDTFVAPKDNRMINYVYPSDQLPDFRLGARPPLPHHGFVSQPPADSNSEKHEMDIDQPSAPEHPPASDDPMQKLVGNVQSLSEQLQQLQYEFVMFQIQQQQLLDQQQ